MNLEVPDRRPSLAEGPPFPRWRRGGAVIAALGGLVIVILTCAPDARVGADEIPPPILCLVCGSIGVADVLHNLLLFMPFAAGLRLAGLSIRQAVLASALLSFGVESMQYFVVAGRDATLSDLLANSVSGWLGATTVDVAPRLWHAGPAVARRLATIAISGLAMVLLATGWLVQPSALAATPLAECPPPPARLKPFIGTRISHAVTPGIPPGTISAQTRIVTGTPPAEPQWVVRSCAGPAPVASIVVQPRRIAAQMRLRADDARLQHLIVGQRLTLAPFDTTEIRAGADGRSLWVEVATGAGSKRTVLPLDAMSGWLLVLPTRAYWSPKRMASLAIPWIAVLVVPIGFWTVRAWGRVAGISSSVAGLVIVALLPVALVGTTPPTFAEWGGIAVGLLIGWSLAAAAVWRRRPSA